MTVICDPGVGHPGPTERNHVLPIGHFPADRSVHLLMLEIEDRIVVPDGAPEQTPGIVRGRRHDHLEPGHVGEERLDRLGVVEGTMDPAAVGRSDGHGHADRVVGPIAHPGRLGHDLVEGRVDEVCELDLGDRAQAVDGRPDRSPDDHRLGQRRVDDPVVAEFGPQPIGGEEDATLASDILAQHDDVAVAAHLLGQRVPDRLDEGHHGHQSRPSSPKPHGGGVSAGHSSA